MNNLNDFYKEKKIDPTKLVEGHSQQVKEQTEFLREIVNDESINNVMEIGFNGGHSAELFLSSNKNIKLTSFDIGVHDYMKLGKEFIDKTYPDRHTLIIGDSLNTVPEYFKKENKKFDLIFIDGGHQYEVAKGDIINCKNLAHENTIVILDDTISKKEWIQFWNVGPNRSWKEAKEDNIIKETGSVDYSSGRGQSWGYYK